MHSKGFIGHNSKELVIQPNVLQNHRPVPLVVSFASEFLVNFVPECQPIKAQFHLQKSVTIRKTVNLCPDYSGKLYSGISGKHCFGIGGKHWLGTVVNFGSEYPLYKNENKLGLPVPIFAGY
ncbi:hypothetical protein, partial [Arenibacter latericius]|uniref:hypothetical protein n=1 Tax=Arenibacter latericius TaxID=86104 RepID=UPI00146C6ADF